MSVRLTTAGSQALTRASPFDYNADFTIGGWFKLKSLGQWHGIMSLLLDTNNKDEVEVQDTNLLGLGSKKAGVSAFVPGSFMALDQWYYMAYTRSGVIVTMYLGTSPTNVAQDAVLLKDPSGRTAATTLYIGLDSFVADYANAEFEAWRAWTATLTLPELKPEAGSASAVRTAALWADWPLGSTADLTDHSGNGRTLTAIGSPTNGATSPPYESAAVTGTATASMTEADVVSGGKTIVLTLTNAKWVG